MGRSAAINQINELLFLQLRDIETNITNLDQQILKDNNLLDKIIRLNNESNEDEKLIITQQILQDLFNFQTERFKNSIIVPNKKNYDTRLTTINGMEYYPWMFGKTLAHPVLGMPTKDDVDLIVIAAETPNPTTIANISRASGAIRPLEGVPCASSYPLMGSSPVLPSANFFQVQSDACIFEMAEVYLKAVLRDIPFSQWNTAPEVANALTALNNLPQGGSSAPTSGGVITLQTLFRGAGIDETKGPYVSQLLLQNFEYGNLSIVQKYAGEKDWVPSITLAGWKDIQEGIQGAIIDKDAPAFTYNGRLLGAKVHNDPLYQFYYNGALILLQNGVRPEQPGYGNSSQWVTGGGPDILAAVAHVALGALRVAWHTKYNVGMKVRPEVYARRVYSVAVNEPNASLIPSAVDIHNALQTSGTLALVKAHNTKVLNDASIVDDASGQNCLLLLQYSEGSPTHPSWPAGHATVAGACCTVMKAMFLTHDADRNPIPWVQGSREAQISSANGDMLETYAGSDASDMTVVGEINKLASNAALGRDWAGVHYRCDGDCGLVLGEQFAIDYIRTKIFEYDEARNGLFTQYTLQKFDGSFVTIDKNGVHEIM